MDFFNRHEPEGTPIPVAMWEAYREGYDDYRYVYTREQLIAEARRSGKPGNVSSPHELKLMWLDPPAVPGLGLMPQSFGLPPGHAAGARGGYGLPPARHREGRWFHEHISAG